jgi:MYXO-CTERM domain-containing protein
MLVTAGGNAWSAPSGGEAGAPADACAWEACPVAEPTAGDPCSPNSSFCEYGNDSRYECDRVYACVSGQFQLERFPIESPGGTQEYPDAGDCPTTVAAGCPSRASLTPGAACTPTLRCTYPEGECDCLQGAGDGGAWDCDPRNLLGDSDAACPEPRPRLGTPCSAPSGYCAYAFDCSFQSCACGEWALSTTECPLKPPPPPGDGAAEGGQSPVDASPSGGDAGLGNSPGTGTAPSSGCGCRTADRHPTSGATAALALGIAWLARRRRSRRSTD